MIRYAAAYVIVFPVLIAGCDGNPVQAQQPDPDQPTVFTQENLDWQPGPPVLPPGAEFAVLDGNPFEGAFTLRLRLPAGYRIPAHSHSSIENVTVISGTVHVGNGDELDTTRGVAVPVGAFVSLGEGTNHYAWAEEVTVVQIHSSKPFDIMYVDPANDPRNQ